MILIKNKRGGNFIICQEMLIENIILNYLWAWHVGKIERAIDASII